MDPSKRSVTVIGAGLAGSEAALQLAKRKIPVYLIEMRPLRSTSAHESDKAAELVCSNSFRGDSLSNAVGLLKEELRRAGGELIRIASECAVPAGGALAVDRDRFSNAVEAALNGSEYITRVNEEITKLPPDGLTIVATGPLTSAALAEDLIRETGEEALYFYDAIAPIIEGDSIDFERAFFQSRYDKGDSADYINCPFNEAEYLRFVHALREADVTTKKSFEKEAFFEACLPAEVMASRGDNVLAFGPMKPVGLLDPKTKKQPHAVVQLRAENLTKSAYNMVGFQTRIRWDQQRTIFRTIPGLEKAVFLRHGSVHRNTFIQSPKLLDEHFILRSKPHIYFAGQLIGVEGYVESIATGFLAGLFAANQIQNLKLDLPPETTMLGGLLRHVTGLSLANPDKFQPSNANWGMVPPLKGRRGRRTIKRLRAADRALKALELWQEKAAEAGIKMLGWQKREIDAAFEAIRARSKREKLQKEKKNEDLSGL